MNDALALNPGQTVQLTTTPPEVLAEALHRDLPGFVGHREPFLIVENDAGRFVQCWVAAPNAYQVEYGEDHAFVHPDGDRSLDDTVAIFTRFAEGVWPPFDNGIPVETAEPARPNRNRRLLIVLVVIALWLAWTYFSR